MLVVSPLPLVSRVRSAGHSYRTGAASACIVGLIATVACHPASPARPSAGGDARFGLGRAATPDEIRAWDIDVRADGGGLPDDSGTAVEGSAIYTARCASCHGADGMRGAVPPAPALVGRLPGDAFPFATDTTAVPTVGNYWPYATTLYDYIHRAMPFTAPGSLSPHDVYALVAFILVRNDIIAPATVMNARTLASVQMPSRGRFVPDDRTGGPHIR
jgi:S-disulfanyl-L-cysteine oxidoreductase SoxD